MSRKQGKPALPEEAPLDALQLATPEGVALRPDDRNPAAVYLAARTTDKSRDSCRAALARAAQALGFPTANVVALPWGSLTYATVSRIKAGLIASGAAPATTNQTLAVVRCVANEAKKLGLLSATEYSLIRDVKGVVGKRSLSGRLIEPGELEKLIAACDSSPLGVRNAALVSFMAITGMRRAEVCSSNMADVDMIAEEVVVVGKNNKQHTHHIGDAMDSLREWLVLRGDAPGPLFMSIDSGGSVSGKRLSERGLSEALDELAERAGVKSLSPHDFRRTVISSLLDETGDLALVQKIIGHTDPKTTERYDMRPIRMQKAAVGKLRVPRRK